MFHPLNSISFRRKAKIYVPENVENMFDKTNQHRDVVGSIIANVNSVGYVLSPEIVERLLTLRKDQLFEFYIWIAGEIKEALGNKRYQPMYPNFPQQVANATDADLYINAVIHYCGILFGMRILPEYEVETRPLFVEILLQNKPIGYIEDPGVIFNEILSSKIPPSDQDKNDLDTCFSYGVDITVTEIPNKEVLAYAVALATAHRSDKIDYLLSLCKTSVDVLRVATALSGGDVSLSDDSKLISFSRPVRRKLLQILNDIPLDNSAEDMMRWREKFKRLGEKLHPGEFKTKYPKAFEAFRLIRNKGAVTFNSRVEKALKKEGTHLNEFGLMTLLKSRPGDFARRLDHVLRTSENKISVLSAFEQVVDKVSTPVLWQVFSYFNSRNQLVNQKNRVFFPKGSTSRFIMAENKLQPLGKFVSDLDMIIRGSLVRRYSQLPALGKVWVDPVIDKLLIPMNNRASSTQLRTVGRGSRFKLEAGKDTIRLFMYWKDTTEGYRVDLDLAAMIYDRDWNMITHCSWTRLREGEMWHSGDIRSAPNGASEFLDIDITKLDPKAAYLVTTVYNYTGQQFSELDTAYAGFMMRDEPNSGEIYEPSTVVSRVDLRGASTSTCPMIVDIRSKEVIWADMAVGFGYCGSVYTSYEKVGQLGNAVANLWWQRPSIGDLMYAHVNARKGTFVDRREDADLVVAEDGDISPFDIAKICSELL
jgi:stress response protein SCP2